MYFILDKKHKLIQFGIQSVNNKPAESGLYFVSEKRYFEDERVIFINFDFFKENQLKECHYRLPFKSRFLINFFSKWISCFVSSSSFIRKIQKITSTKYYKNQVMVRLVVITFLGIQILFPVSRKLDSIQTVNKNKQSMSYIQALEYLGNTNFAKKIKKEKQGFVAADALFYGSSRGFLAIPLEEFGFFKSTSKPVVLISHGKSVLTSNGVDRELKAPLLQKKCRDNLSVALVDGHQKIIFINNIKNEKKIKKFILLEANQNQDFSNICEQYETLIEKFEDFT